MLATKIQIQGREAGTYGVPKYVKRFRVSYSVDGIAIKFVHVGKSLIEKEFVGNSDGKSVVDVEFAPHPPLLARYFRIHPTEWQHDICLRLEIYACG